MRTNLFVIFVSVSLLFTSCMKHAGDFKPSYGDELNTWTFSDGNKFYYGKFQSDPVLNTTPQSNHTFTLDMTGTELSGEKLTLVLSLADLDFSVRAYQSGISGSDHFTALYYSGSATSSAAIYASTNNSPGAVMNYTIIHYNDVKSIATIMFDGEAFNANGNKVNIVKGKLTARILRK